MALGDGGALDPLHAESAEAVPGWLACGGANGVARTEEIVLRSGDPDELTLREARLLGSADLLAHEQAVPVAILDRARADAARVAIAPGSPAPVGSGATVVLRAAPA